MDVVPATDVNQPDADAAADPTASESDAGNDGDAGDLGGGLVVSWFQLIALVLAFAFLGGAIVTFWNNRPASPGSVDVGFYRDMTTHHEQAVQLALIELDRGENPIVQSFAREILIFQDRELGIMDTRLNDWGQPAAERPPTAMGWMGMRPVPVEQMPGLATDEQIADLRAAAGAEADALFLDLMAEHHRGGVHMANYAAEHADRSEVRALARRMARQQSGEINEMAQTADRLGFDIEIEPAVIPSG